MENKQHPGDQSVRDAARAKVQKANLEKLDLVLANLPESQYEHEPVTEHESAARHEAITEREPVTEHETAAPQRQKQKRRGRPPKSQKSAAPAKDGTQKEAPAPKTPDAQKGNPGAQQENPGAQKRSPGAQQGHPNARQGGSGGQKGDPNAQKGSSGDAKGTPRPQKGNSGGRAKNALREVFMNRAPSGWKPTAPTGWNQKKRGRPSKNAKLPPLKITPLGGLGEIGKNITAFEYGEDIVIVDCGLAFPGDEMLGVDLVIPDFTYLEENRDRIRGLVVTHGHEDHIGGIPFLLQKMNIPIYATRFTIALIEGKLAEKGLLNKALLNVVKPRDTVTLGCMTVEFIHVNHSIPDSCALALHTPAGIVIETGDFKVDYTPTNDEIIDLARFGELGSKGVLALLSDSTNAERPGYTPSERTVGESFDLLFKNAGERRILVATFSSNVHRVQIAIDSAVRFGRKVAVVGRSMEQVTAKALEMGYLVAPEGTVVSLDTICRLPENEAVIVTTGSQGETMAALTRMAMGDHRKININSRDLVIISAYPIPGNEKDVGRVVNELMRLGAEVVYERYSQIHVSGHACQDEEKLMLALTKPRFFIPVHGEYKHLKKHAELAMSMGMPPENVMIPEIGRVIEVNEAGINATSSVSAGAILVDGLGVGDVGSVVLRDRKRLGEDGLIIVTLTLDRDTGEILAGPDIVSRGFVYVREAEDMLEAARQIARKTVQASVSDNKRDWQNLKTKIKDAVGSYLFGLTKRSPMVLPIIEEIAKAAV